MRARGAVRSGNVLKMVKPKPGPYFPMGAGLVMFTRPPYADTDIMMRSAAIAKKMVQACTRREGR